MNRFACLSAVILVLVAGACDAERSSSVEKAESNSQGAADATLAAAKVVDRAQHAATEAARNNRRVLVTIDDLPLAMYDDYTSQTERRETVRKLSEKLEARDIPVVGFFNMANHARDPDLTEMWMAGEQFRAGNHTWSHPHIKRTDPDDYIADLERGHEAVRPLVDPERRVPFRYPYLARGFDPEVRDAIRAKLEELDSPVIPVTINTLDWLYARDYLDALHAGDGERADELARVWLANIQEETMIAEQLARELFGRLPPQILLLHANRLNADHIDEALDWYEQRGYAFIGLDEAMADPAFDIEPERTSRIGIDQWRRLLRERAPP